MKLNLLFKLSYLSSNFALTLPSTLPTPCLVPVRRFPSPSRSIRFGDVSEANGPRDPKHFGREEK